MDYRLVVVRGRSGSETIELADGVTTLGRHDDCQLRIKSSQVSRRHCEIFEKKGLLLVKDLGSSNGTFVNGKRIEGQRVLEVGDELTIGQVKLRVDKRSAPAGTPAPKPNDTAVGAPVPAVAPAEDAAADLDTVVAPPSSTSAEPADDFDIEFFEMPETTAPAPPAEPPSEAIETATPSAAQPVAEPEVADDAVKDFLLDIKFDDDDA